MFQATVGACTKLIEKSLDSGKTSAYTLAAAHYKRGNINAGNKRLEVALKDYKKAAALFPFPQLVLEIERLKKHLGKSRSAKRAQQPRKATAKRPRTPPAASSRKLTAKSRPVVKSVRPKPVTPDQRKFVLPTVKLTRANGSKRTARSKKIIEWPERASRYGTKTSELWETNIERVIKRYQVKSRPPKK